MKKLLKYLLTSKLLIFIVLLGIVFRLSAGFAYTDLVTKIQYFEFGPLAQNLLAGKGYSYYYFENHLPKHSYKPEVKPYPSAYMPPGYPAFLCSFFLIQDPLLRTWMIVVAQALIAGIVILLTYFYSLTYFNTKTALLAAAIVAFLPEFIYATYTIGPTLLFHLLVLLYFILLKKERNKVALLLLGLLGGIILYFRTEFFLFVVFVALIEVFEKRYKAILYILLLPILSILPWTWRNYKTFHEVIPVSTNFGINFIRGHNPKPGAWPWGLDFIEEGMHEDQRFEVEINQLFLKKGVNFITKHPGQEAINDLKKIVSFWTFDFEDPRSGNLLYWLPWALLLVFSGLGICSNFDPWKFRFEYAYFINSTLLVVIFFSQIRYQTLMKILLIPFAAYGFWRFCELAKLRLKITAGHN